MNRTCGESKGAGSHTLEPLFDLVVAIENVVVGHGELSPLDKDGSLSRDLELPQCCFGVLELNIVEEQRLRDDGVRRCEWEGERLSVMAGV